LLVGKTFAYLRENLDSLTIDSLRAIKQTVDDRWTDGQTDRLQIAYKTGGRPADKEADGQATDTQTDSPQPAARQAECLQMNSPRSLRTNRQIDSLIDASLRQRDRKADG